MTRRIKFEKVLHEWYAVIPEWEGERAELQMVAGADTWLDLICEGAWDVWMTISDAPFAGAEELHLIELGKLEGPEIGTGAWYIAKTYLGLEFNLKMWLCDVTKFVFGDFPKTIYYKV
jgi:hypothetical protein